MARLTFHVTVNEEEDGTFWASVEELPGCFASGHNLGELEEALSEAIQMCLPDDIELGQLVSFEPKARKQKSQSRELVYG